MLQKIVIIIIIIKLITIKKINEIENKITSISGLATTSALIAVENYIPNVSSLVKKTGYNIKVTEIAKKLNYHNEDQ